MLWRCVCQYPELLGKKYVESSRYICSYGSPTYWIFILTTPVFLVPRMRSAGLQCLVPSVLSPPSSHCASGVAPSSIFFCKKNGEHDASTKKCIWNPLFRPHHTLSETWSAECQHWSFFHMITNLHGVKKFKARNQTTDAVQVRHQSAADEAAAGGSLPARRFAGSLERL